MTSLAPGTQWSQKARLSLPAAWAPRTKGTLKAAAAPAVVPRTRRRVIVGETMCCFLSLDFGGLAAFGGMTCRAPPAATAAGDRAQFTGPGESQTIPGHGS